MKAERISHTTGKRKHMGLLSVSQRTSSKLEKKKKERNNRTATTKKGIEDNETMATNAEKEGGGN